MDGASNPSSTEPSANALRVFSAFKDLLIVGKECAPNSSLFFETPIPTFDSSVLNQLCVDSIEILKYRPTIAHIEPPVYVVGDLNGSIIDLVRIISKCNSISTNKFVFLGNFIGPHGKFNPEVLIFLLAMFCLYPENIILLRGSNEFEENSTALNFSNDLREAFGPKNEYLIHSILHETFAWLPLAAVISNQVFCSHAGISSSIVSIDQLKTVERPIFTSSNEIVDGLTSSNPLGFSTEILRTDSTTMKNDGFFKLFVKNNHLRKVIKGHEYIEQGLFSTCGGHLVTVFSSSNYNIGTKNKPGFLFVNGLCDVRGYSLPCSPDIRRKNAALNFIGIMGLVRSKRSTSILKTHSSKNQGGYANIKFDLSRKKSNLKLLTRSTPMIVGITKKNASFKEINDTSSESENMESPKRIMLGDFA